MRTFLVVSFVFGVGGVALAEQPAHDRTCRCSCVEQPPPAASVTPGQRTDVNRNDIERTSGVDVQGSTGADRAVGSDAPLPMLPPRKVPNTDPGRPHIFSAPPTPLGTPGLPTPYPWNND